MLIKFTSPLLVECIISLSLYFLFLESNSDMTYQTSELQRVSCYLFGYIVKPINCP